MKKYIYFCIIQAWLVWLMPGITTASAQSPEIEWQVIYGGSGNELIKDIDVTNSGYVLAGESWSWANTGNKYCNHYGFSDYWVVALDADGQKLWDVCLGGDDADRPTDIDQTADGGFIVLGESGSDVSGEKNVPNYGYTDYWLLKLANNGFTIEWQKDFGGTGFDNGRSVEQTSDGGYIVAGSSSSGISGNKTEASRGSDDYWILKLDAVGNIEWQRAIGGNSAEWLYSIHQTPDGGYIVGGSSSSAVSGEKTEPSKGGRDYWIVKLNVTGDIEWQKVIGGNMTDQLYDALPTFDGGYILGGESYSGISGDKSEGAMDYDYWIVKVDGSGNILWENTIAGNSLEQYSNILETPDGGFLVAGKSISAAGVDKTEPVIGGDDYWIVRLDSLGNILWDNTIGGTGVESNAYACQPDAFTYAVAGTSWSGISGDKTIANFGEADFWMVKLLTEPNDCVVPGGLTSATLPDKAKVQWSGTPEAIGYKVRYRIEGDEAWMTRYVKSTKQFVILKSLSCSTTYEWQVMSICSPDFTWNSPYSESAYFTTAACRLPGTTAAQPVSIFPNPATDNITISFTDSYDNIGGISIYTLTGQLALSIEESPSDGEVITISTRGLDPGLYIISVECDDIREFGTFMIVR